MKKLACAIRFCRRYLEIDNGKYIYSIYIKYSMCNQVTITQTLINRL